MGQSDEETMSDLKRDLENRVSMAAEIAEKASNFREKAFDRLLDFLLQQGREEPRVSKGGSREVRSMRRIPKTSTESIERIRAVLDAPPDIVSEYPGILSLNPRGRVYCLIQVVREKFGIDGLTFAELRAVANDKFRLGIPEGTLSGTLSKAPATEIGRTAKGDETIYKLLLPGEEYLRAAMAKLEAKSMKEVSGG